MFSQKILLFVHRIGKAVNTLFLNYCEICRALTYGFGAYQGFNYNSIMIITRYLTRQVLSVTFAITFILLIVVVLGRFLKYLAQASQGEIDPEVLALLMSYRLPEFVQLILPLAILLGILLTYGRMYAENEMTVLVACGLSSKRLLGITLLGSSLITLVVAFLSLVVTPWGLVNAENLLEAQKELNEFDIMVPGVFQNIGRGERTTYTENIMDDEMQFVFMHDTNSNRVTLADKAVPVEDDKGDRFVLFSDGSMTEELEEDGKVITNFGEMGVRIPERELTFDETLEEKALPTTTLIGSSENRLQAELQWRVSLVLLIPVLTLLAIPLSKVSPRQGQYAKLVPAVLIYILYFGLILVSRDMISEGKLSAILGVWWVHGLFLVLGVLVFQERLKLPAFVGGKR